MYALASPADKPPDIWQALADPTRRWLIDRLASGPMTTSALCEGAAMSRFGVMKHLGVLERAGLVTARRQGRLRLNHLDAAPLHALHRRWVSPQAARLGALAGAIGTFTEGTGMDRVADIVGVSTVALDWDIRSPVQRVWAAIFEDVDRWWPAGHRALTDSVMTLRQEIGGGLVEAGRDGSTLLWYSLTAIQPLRSIDLVGHLAARYGGPGTSHLHLELVPTPEEGITRLRMTDSVVAATRQDGRSTLEEGWQAILGEGLVAHLETRR
jgi:DNA-binding transcriptional ArsR family regulator/uncharacterized protein YndB with AHSA1/START domain